MAKNKRKARGHYHHGDLRRALLDTALQLIEEEGVGAVTIRSLARRLGVSHAAPAHHFKDRDGLLMEVATEGFKAFAKTLEAAATSALDPADRLAAVGRAYVRFAADHPAHLRVMFGQAPPEATLPEGLQRESGRSFQVLIDAIKALLPASASEPLVLELAIGAWSLVHGLAMLWIDGRIRPLTPTRAALDALAERTIRGYLPALMARFP